MAILGMDGGVSKHRINMMLRPNAHVFLPQGLGVGCEVGVFLESTPH